mmetsp:Transcript_6623/g.9791  ORF Transcript_6623/g.9791 Transcript_6623/m.9791 type:complete len:106 (-) Transcript_6623:562-879(-)
MEAQTHLDNLMSFVSLIQEEDYEEARKLIEPILAVEPNNKFIKEFQNLLPLVEKKIENEESSEESQESDTQDEYNFEEHLDSPNSSSEESEEEQESHLSTAPSEC